MPGKTVDMPRVSGRDSRWQPGGGPGAGGHGHARWPPAWLVRVVAWRIDRTLAWVPARAFHAGDRRA